MNDEQSAAAFTVERIVLKDLSFETPMGQAAFATEWQPEYKVRLHLNHERIADDRWEFVLTATVTAHLESQVAFVIEAQQSGIVKVDQLEGEPLRRVAAIDIPLLIFPYLRETIDSVALKGGFPPVNLQPLDFEARYRDSSATSSTV